MMQIVGGYSVMNYYLIYIAMMSVTGFMLYGIDKYKAMHSRFRIRESVLLSVGIMGGAAGTILGMLVFRHKTRHWYFWFVNAIGAALQLSGVYLIWRYL